MSGLVRVRDCEGVGGWVRVSHTILRDAESMIGVYAWGGKDRQTDRQIDREADRLTECRE